MNRTQSPLGRASLFGALEAAQTTTSARLHRRAGRPSRVNEPAFDQLEQRQMLFALAVPAGGTTAAQQFGYFTPFLFKQLPTIQAPEIFTETLEPFDQAPLAYPSGAPFIGASSTNAAVVVSHTGFGNNPQNFPRLIDVTTAFTAGGNAGGVDETDVELNINLTAGRTVSFSTINPTTGATRRARAFSFTTLNTTQPPLTTDQIARGADGTFVQANVQIQLLRNNVLIATYDTSGNPGTFDLAGVRVDTVTTRGLSNYRVFDENDPTNLFDEVRFVPRNAGDRFDVIDVSFEFPPGNFAQFNDERIQAGNGRIVGPSNGAIDAATNNAPNGAVGATVNEIFDDDTGALNRRLASGTLFASNVRLDHTGYNAGNSPQIVTGANGGADRALNFGLAGTQTVSLSFRDARGQARPMTAFTFTTRAGATDLDAGTQVQLFRRGALVRTYSALDFVNPDPNAVVVRFQSTVDPNDNIYLFDTTTFTENFGGSDFDPNVNPDLIDNFGAAFDEVRISRLAGGTDAGGIQIDRVSPFAPAMVEFFDLYGRPMRPTIALTAPDEGPSLADANDNGVPDFNDGIGRIEISNGNASTNFTIIGGDATFDATLGFQYVLPTQVNDYYDTNFSQAGGFGFALDFTQTPPRVIGLADTSGLGNIIIGAPFFRDNTNDVSYHGLDTSVVNDAETPSTLPLHASLAPITPLDLPLTAPGDFSNVLTQSLVDLTIPQLPQGVFTPGGTDTGAITINGMVFGNSNLGGAAARFNVANLFGSLTVNGDIGTLAVAGDSGLYFITPTVTTPPRDQRGENTTGSNINILRNAGQIYFGGRNAARVTVFGDANNALLGRRNFAAYGEQETIFGFTGATEPEQTYLQSLLATATVRGANSGASPLLLGDLAFRNDTMQAAEFVGNAGSFVSIAGTLGNFNDLQGGEDLLDVYGVPGQVGRTLTFDVSFRTAGPGSQDGDRASAFLVNGKGETVRAHQAPLLDPNRIPGTEGAVRFTYTPDTDDVYYLIVSIPGDGQPGSTQVYTVSINGMASTSSGMISATANNLNFIEVRSSLGLFRSGGGVVDRVGSTSYITGNIAVGNGFTTIEEDDDLLEPHGGQLRVAGSLYSLTFGSDVEGGVYNIGGNLGSLRTGYFYSVDPQRFPPVHGDITGLTLDVGGSIGRVEVGRDLGNRNDPYQGGGTNPSGPSSIVLRTGLSGGDGSIGYFRVQGIVVGQAVSITLLGVSSGLYRYEAVGGTFLGQPTLRFPDGGPAGFIDPGPSNPAQPRPGIPQQPDVGIPLLYGQALTLTSSSGVVYTIEILGGTASRASAGRVLAVPVSGAPGAAVGRIEVNLVGGAELRVTANTPGRLQIGNIVVTTAPPAVGIARASTVTLRGVGEIDVASLTQTRAIAGAADLDAIVNSTVGGDIVYADVTGVNRVVIAGNLGLTQTGVSGPRLLGPNLGFVPGTGLTASFVGFAIPLDNAFFGGWNGATYRYQQATAPGESLQDAGGLDSNINGLVVRQGNLTALSVNGQVGDIFVPNGNITNVVVNADVVAGDSGFDGVVGTIYTNGNIGTIDLGRGLFATDTIDSLAITGIFASGSITSITAGNRAGAPIINGIITAAGTGAPNRGQLVGLGSITVTGGRIDGAYISGSTLDSFWRSPVTANPTQLNPGDLSQPTTFVRNVSVVNGSIFASSIFATNVTSVSVVGGAFDATSVSASVTVGTVRADRFINSTRDGEPLEYRPSQISGTLSIGRIAVNGAGDISDLFVFSTGTLLGGLTARNITRLTLDVDQTVASISATNDIRSSTIAVGRVDAFSAGGDIRSSTIDVAGPIGSLTARGAITNTAITSTGVNGRINSISAGAGGFSGTITSSGPIVSVVSGGSLAGVVTTTDATDGDLTLLRAVGDAPVTLNIARNIATISAGGSFGRRPTDAARDAVDVNGTLGTLTAGGQLYANLRVGQTINAIIIGRVSATPANDLVGDPSITAFGRINSVNITGDFNGSILSDSGGIGSVVITNGSFRLGNDDDASGVIDSGERNRIEARDGNITSVVISNGSLFGDIVARDGDITIISVTGVGAFGRIGIDRALSTATAVTGDALRNQLPPGTPSTGGFGGTAAFDGPIISAGRDIGTITSTGAAFEVSIFAARNITTVSTGGFNTDALGAIANANSIAAGDTVSTVLSRGLARGLTVVAGATSLGADQRLGGTAANADGALKSGRVTTVTATGGSNTLAVSAGVNAGTDGLYNSADGDGSETAAPGISTVGTVTVTGGAVTASTVSADTTIGATTAGITRSTGALPADARTFTGATNTFTPAPTGGLAITTTSGQTGRVTFTGPGQAFWDAANNRVVLISSTLASTLRVDAVAPSTSLTNFGVVSNDDAQLGSLVINAALTSNTTNDTADRSTRVFVDGTINVVTIGNTVITADAALAGSGIIAAGEGLGVVRIGTAGTAAVPAAANQFRLEGQNITSVTVLGDLGTSTATRIDALNLGTVSVTGALRGVISSTRNITTVTATGALNGGRVRAGGDITSVSAAGAAGNARISARGNIGTVSLRGDVADSTILSGVDLGTDGTFGGTGSAADVITSGNIASVVVTGSFQRSDVAAGIARGVDGFVNTADDLVAEGRSTIGSVVITGQLVGSNVNSQRYGVISNGTVTTTLVGGTALTTTRANFSKVSLTRLPPPIQITDIRVTDRAPRLYTARLTVNQALDPASIGAALSISEVRNVAQAEQLVPLVQGTDYSFRFDATTNTLIIDFAESVTTRNLVGNTPGATAGPGVFRFTIDAGTLRGTTQGSQLDGDRNGAAGGVTDDYTEDAVVGDAGDRFISGQTIFTDGSAPVDFYAPASLDQLLTVNRANNFLPDANRTLTVRGSLGDHADANNGTFAPGGDIDIYTISLKAGQTLRLGALTGSALGASVVIFDGSGALVAVNGQATAGNLQATPTADPNSTTTTFLVRTTGTYQIVIVPDANNLIPVNPLQGFIDPADPTSAVGAATAGGTTGDYAFTLQIVDDKDSGFFGNQLAPTAAVADAQVPTAADFAGPDTVVGTADDLVSLPVADTVPANPQFTFQLFAGADNTFNTADDFVLGSNGNGTYIRRVGATVTTTRTSLAGSAPVDPDAAGPLLDVPVPTEFSGVDNTFNTADDLTTVTRAGTDGRTFNYTLLPGPDGVRGTADDIVNGTNLDGVRSSRRSGVDLTFGTGDDVIRLNTDSGAGVTINDARLRPSDFAGVDTVLGTADDIATITIADTTFRLDRGANRRVDGNGAPNLRSDDVVIGTTGSAAGRATITTTRTSGADGIFGTADDVFTTLADAANGAAGSAGVPSTGQIDADVYHINGGSAVAPGTRIRATLKVSEIGGNLGLLEPVVAQRGSTFFYQILDNRGLVQFAFFDTSASTGLGDANLIAAPRDVGGSAGQNPGSTTDGSTTYGVDANGDFFMEFLVPPRVDNAAQSGTFAFYVQGAIRSDYQLEIVTRGAGTPVTPGQTQNVLIETAGGVISWLEATPYESTTIGAFDSLSSGFSGLLGANNLPADQFFLTNLITNLNAIFAAAGIAVTFSTNAADFEGQDFSTVFVTGSNAPAAFFNNGEFGVSQKVDIFNTDRNDQAVVFLPDLNTLGFNPDNAGASAYLNSLTAAVTRRVGELVGLRTSASTGNPAPGANADPMAGNSPRLTLGVGSAYRFTNASVLSSQGDVNDTQFVLGNIVSVPLLNRIFGNP